MKHYVESAKSKKDRMMNWHKFFTLLPRKIKTDDPKKDVWVWLETIERKKSPECYIGIWVVKYEYEYRLIEE